MSIFHSQNFNPDSLASHGEQAVRNEYSQNGYKILGTNLFNSRGKRIGEIDFIAHNKDSIIFVEVKTRQNQQSKYGIAAESITISKQRKLIKTIKLFLLYHPQYMHLRPQIDVALATPLDKTRFSVTILSNAVTDLS